MPNHKRQVLRSRRSTESSDGGGNNNKTIRVIAPATLAEGYTFDVDVAGQAVRVTVPAGGVEKGEEFEFPMPAIFGSSKGGIKQSAKNAASKNKTTGKKARSRKEHVEHDDDDDDDIEEGPDSNKETPDSPNLDSKPTASSSSNSDDDTQHDSLGAPMGKWRHHLCGCCDVLTQATFWMAFCCAPVLIAQLLTRLGLNWKGNKASTAEEASFSFNRIVMSFIAVLVVGNIPVIGYLATFIFTVGLLAWTGRNLRRTVRQRYQIPASVVHEKVDDCLCMVCCGCCATIQMARHTHDDKEYPGSCCTTTGLDMDAPHIV